MHQYLDCNWGSMQVQKDIDSLRNQAKIDAVDKSFDPSVVPQIADASSSKIDIINSVVANVFWQMDQDRKITALKELQGHMWRDGYESGIISGQ